MSDRKRAHRSTETQVEFVPRTTVSRPPTEAPAALSRRRAQMLMLAGVIFPAAVILIEAVWGLCAQAFFDPLPTMGHVAIASLVPASNLFALAILRDRVRMPVWFPMVSGAAMAVAVFYALLFLPMLPLAVVAVIFYGLGLLPFGPAASLLTGWALRSRLKARDPAPWTRRSAVAGVAIGCLALAGLDLPSAATRIGLTWAVSSDATERARGLSLIRTVGDRDELLRLAYDTGGRSGGPLSLLIGLSAPTLFDRAQRTAAQSPAEVREVFYRAYGLPFNALPPPQTGRQWSRFDDFAFDADHGGATVGGRIKGLSLQSSRIDGSINGDDAVGYLEWVLEFRNVSGLDREARVTVALPPGGVVSRATLWINGEEREAAYGGRGEVRRAYEQVAVQQRRDPLLVTTKGADRVLAQAFPVPRDGTLKFKLGITAPLDLTSLDRGTLALPAIIDRNFSIDADVRHAVWIESKTPLKVEAGSLAADRVGSSVFRVTGEVSDRDLANLRPEIEAARDAAVVSTVALSDGAPSTVQTIRSDGSAKPETLVVVVDGSARMAAAAPGLAAALETLPEGLPVGLHLAAESGIDLAPAPWAGGHKSAVLSAIRGHAYIGGQDNTEALAQALKRASAAVDARILWVHGPQPLRFAKSAARLDQASERLTRVPALDLYAIEPGANELLPDAPWGWQARMLASHGHVGQDLGRYFASTFGPQPRITITRTPLTVPPPETVAEASGHLGRLWAKDRVLELMAKDAARHREAAVTLASGARLVTPVSGAVVLETKAQYDAHGLTAASPTSVPTVPEPHEWALMLIALLAMTALLRPSQAARRAVA